MYLPETIGQLLELRQIDLEYSASAFTIGSRRTTETEKIDYGGHPL